MAGGGRGLLIVFAAAMALVPAALAQTDDKEKDQAVAASAPPAPPPADQADDAKPQAVDAPDAAAGTERPAAPLIADRVGASIDEPTAASASSPASASTVPTRDAGASNPALPALPATPAMADTPYPDCRDDYQAIEDAFEKAERTTACVATLDAWHAEILVPYRQAMLDHQQAIAELYESQVQNNFAYSQTQRDGFFEAVTAEHEASNLDGAHLAPYREAMARYDADRAYLQERFCRYADNCPGWRPIAETAERDAADARVAPTVAPGEQSASRRSGGGNSDCNVEHAGGGLLGGLLGGVLGEATGLGALAGAIIGQAAGVLVADIACRLEPEEQVKAVEATEEVIAAEEVGATAEWTSPTRADVSGSSTVTALNSQPSGARCLDITDIVIIGGEETSVNKTMCRQPGESRYTLQA